MSYRECSCYLLFAAFLMLTFNNGNSVNLVLKDWSLKNVVLNGGSKIHIQKTNWKECVWNKLNDDKDNGLIKSCSFKKKHANTSLKVVVSSDMRVAYCDNCCKRWYVTFNGKECSPFPIDGIIHLGKGKGFNTHRPHGIRGHCQNIKAGTVSIGFYVGNCAGFGNANAYTGYNSAMRIYIEEKEPMQS